MTVVNTLRIKTEDGELDLDWNYDLIDALNQANEAATDASGEPAIMVYVEEGATIKSVVAIRVETETLTDGSKTSTIYLEVADA